MRAALLVLVVACRSTEPARCADRARCPQPVDIVLEHTEPQRGDLLLELGDTAGALAMYQRSYDRVLSARGDRNPALADAIDKLAAARRAQGKLRDALRLHDRSVKLRDDAGLPVSIALVERAATHLEAGEITAARRDLRAADNGSSSARFRVHAMTLAIEAAAGNRRAADQLTGLARTADLAPHEPLTVSRSAQLAIRVRLLVAAGRHHEAKTLAREMHERLLPERNPILAAEVGCALLAVGERAAAATVLAHAVTALGNEPTRTALRVFTQLARASDTQAAAAARAAIALYQAMPALDRAEHDDMWLISRR